MADLTANNVDDAWMSGLATGKKPTKTASGDLDKILVEARRDFDSLCVVTRDEDTNSHRQLVLLYCLKRIINWFKANDLFVDTISFGKGSRQFRSMREVNDEIETYLTIVNRSQIYGALSV